MRTKRVDIVKSRVLVYVLTVVILSFSEFFLRDVFWTGSKNLHTIMESIATVLAALVGIVALVHYYSDKTNHVFLFVGAGFLGTSFLDGYHAVVTSEFFDIYFPSPPESLIPWSWIASRLFLAVVLFASSIYNRYKKDGSSINERVVFIYMALATLASFLFFAFVPLPRAYYPELFLHRPEELLPAAFFALALYGYLKKGKWRVDVFEHWLVLSMIVGLVGQVVFMSFSHYLFDFEFDVAHLLKKLSYIYVLTGLLISMFVLFKKVKTTNEELEEHKQNLEKTVAEQTQELRESEAFLIRSQSIAKVGSWKLDIKNNILDWSDELYNIFEIQKSEFKHTFESFLELVHPQDKDKINRVYKESLKNNLSYGIEHRILMKNGDVKYVYEQCETEYDENNKPIYSIGTMQDVTEYTELLNKLMDKQDYLQSLFDVIPDIMITTNGVELDRANPAMLEFFGFQKVDDFKAQHDCICDFFIEEENCIHAKMGKNTWLDYLLSTPQGMHKVAMNKNGDRHVFLVSARSIKLGNGDKARPDIQYNKTKTNHHIVIFSEITKLEEVNKELQNKEEIMLAQSRHAAMGEMIGMIAHQWRQPITSIAMGANNIIVDVALGNLNEESLDDLATDIIEQTQYLSKTIDDFRNFFKPNKELEETDVCKVFEETVSIIGTSLTNHNIELKENFNCSSKIFTYSRELLQVYINILKNAKEALIDREIEDAFIDISISEDENFVISTICDNAGGIDEKIINKIFEPYFTTKDKKTGTGLGLYMSKTIVDKHLNGTLSVQNDENGACFIIKLLKDTK